MPRSDADIDRAIKHLSQACTAAQVKGDSGFIRQAEIIVDVLRWVKGDDAGPFGRLVMATCDEVDRRAKRHERG